MELLWIRIGFALLLLSPVPASAEHPHVVILQNDGTVAGTPSTVLHTLVAGESVSSWFTATCDGKLVGAQIHWASEIGTAPSSVEDSITFFANGTFPFPGAVLQNDDSSDAIIVVPQLFDSVMNEFRYTDPPANTQALSIPVSNGETFSVALKLLNTSSPPPFGTGIALDQDGCQAGVNAVDVQSVGWMDACPLGVTGDFIIRAILACEVSPVPAASAPARIALIALVAFVGALVAVAQRPLTKRSTSTR